MASVQPAQFFNSPALSREQFNRIAGSHNIPFLITSRLEDPAKLTPAHLEFASAEARDRFVSGGEFTPAFRQEYTRMVEVQRRSSVALALAEARTVTQITDVSQKPAHEQEMLRHLRTVSKLIDDLYMKQEGTYEYIDDIEAIKDSDPNSYKLFWRELGPKATTTNGDGDVFANALPDFPEKVADVFPKDIQNNTEELNRIGEDKKGLGNPFTVVVRNDAGELVAVPYHIYWKTEMDEIAAELDLAADAIKSDPQHASLNAYLTAAAQAFRDGDWHEADRKWVGMNMNNSQYAVRVAPDETYWGPGNMKAGFEFYLAEIDRETAKDLRTKLSPRLQDMENEIHNLVPHYQARQLVMDFPDFVTMILRGGDHKSPYGATIGQKLPNFSDEFSRMLIMTNYYADPESTANGLARNALLLSAEILAGYNPEPDDAHIPTLLHEGTHYFGPQASTLTALNRDGTAQVDGEGQPITVDVALGGTNSQVMEELKAQTGALYFIGWAKEQGIISEEKANNLYTKSILWAFGHISRGMGTLDKPRTYSQLSGIQIKWLMDAGVVTYGADERFSIDHSKMHAAVTSMMKEVVEVQVYGDGERATAWRESILEGTEGFEQIRGKEVRQRSDGYPTASFELGLQF